MAAPRAWQDEFTLLCERCGYVIEGLPHQGACPECGKPIAESLPERRTGTAWQRQPRIARLPIVWWRSLRHPLATLDLMQPQTKPDARLGIYSMFAGALLMGWGWWDPLLWLYLPSRPSEEIVASDRLTGVVFSLAFGVITAVLLTGVMWTLTRVETKGLGVIARTRRFRLSPGYRKAITAHGCVGWVLGGVLFFLFCTSGGWLLEISRAPDWQIPSSGSGGGVWWPGPSRLPWWLEKPLYHFRWLGLLVGFLWFETFAYLGLRRLKYANASRPQATDVPAG